MAKNNQNSKEAKINPWINRADGTFTSHYRVTVTRMDQIITRDSQKPNYDGFSSKPA